MNNMQTDIIIVAAGTAGLAAAVTAAERGARVIALEKGGHYGGNGNMAGGPFAVESRYQKVKQYPLTREQAFKIHMDFTHWTVNARLVKTYIDRSAGTLDWLEGMGIEFYDTAAHGAGMNYTWHLIKIPPGKPKTNGGYLVMDALAKKAAEMGVQVLMKTPVKKIIKEGNRVTGVIAEDKDGETIEVKGKAVILATGGYGAYWRAPMGIPLYGDGLHMAQVVGADVTEGTIVSMLTMGGNAPPAGGPPVKPQATMLIQSAGCVFQQPVLLVNLLGERFTDEDAIINTPAGSNAISSQKNGTAFAIIDENTKDHFVRNGLDYVSGYGILMMGGDPVYKPVSFDAEIKEITASGRGNIFVADTLEELAIKMGVNKTTFLKTIEEYNVVCRTGRDSTFGKPAKYLRPVEQPRFYASKRMAMPGGAPEGIRINYRTEVLTKDHETIPGLYAAGMDTACNIYHDLYVNYLPGNAFGWALNSGRMAAENAVEYIKREQEK